MSCDGPVISIGSSCLQSKKFHFTSVILYYVPFSPNIQLIFTYFLKELVERMS